MFTAQRILIVEDESLIAMDLADAVTELGGHVIGPVASVKAAIELLDHGAIAGAILDCQLSDRNITPVVLRAADAGIPFVVYSATGLPPELGTGWSAVPMLHKPADIHMVVARLWTEMQAMSHF